MQVDHRKAGVTLIELVTALVVLGILVSLAAPSLRGTIARAQVSAALNQFAGDMARARMLAVRSGGAVELRFTAASACGTGAFGRPSADRYRIIAYDPAPRVVETVRVGGPGSGVCLDTNNDSTIVFSSRGLLVPFENRTVSTRKGGATSLITISVLGRILRRE